MTTHGVAPIAWSGSDLWSTECGATLRLDLRYTIPKEESSLPRRDKSRSTNLKPFFGGLLAFHDRTHDRNRL